METVITGAIVGVFLILIVICSLGGFFVKPSKEEQDDEIEKTS